MDVNALKGRIAEALVEGIFRWAGYQVALIGRESRVQHLLKMGSDEFLPDLLVWKPVAQTDSDRSLHRLVAVEVKYRADLERYLPRCMAKFSTAVEQWPNLYFVFVTDHPEGGRSCFQAVDVRRYSAGKPMETVDLHNASELDIYRKNVEDHECLVRLIFPLLSSRLGGEELSRKPGAKVAAPTPLLRNVR